MLSVVFDRRICLESGWPGSVLNAKANDLENRLDNLIKRLGSVEVDNQRLREQLQDAREQPRLESSESLPEDLRLIASLREANAELSAQLEKAEKETDQYRAQIDTKFDTDDLRSIIQDLQEKLDKSQSELNNTIALLQELSSDYDALLVRHENLQKAHKALLTQLRT